MKAPEILKVNNSITRERGSLFSKNQEFTVECIDHNAEGFGVCKIDDFVVFTKGLLLHEKAIIKLTKVFKNYAYARIVIILLPSTARIDPRCSVYTQCGGCDLMHATYTYQQDFKQQLVKGQFDYHGLSNVNVLPIRAMDNPWHYRNKVSTPVQSTQKNTQVGFYRAHSHDIVEFDTCHVQSELQNKVITFIKEFLKQHPISSLRHVVLKQSGKPKTLMVGFVNSTNRLDHQDDLIQKLTRNFPQISSIILNINSKQTNTIFGNQDITLYGESFIIDTCLAYQFKISLRSFYQVNPSMMEVLYQEAIQAADIQPNDVVLDCYCGIGTISLVASGHAKWVYGIEVNPKAIDDAKENAQLNRVHNATFYCMDAKEALTFFKQEHITIDTMIVDPPRSGMHESLVEAIIASNIKKVVYVSCNPKTLARDCSKLANAYQIMDVQPVDMFPQTKHVETVVLITKKND